MPYNFAGGDEGDQGWLLPPDPREWLPPGHLAWAVLALDVYRKPGVPSETERSM